MVKRMKSSNTIAGRWRIVSMSAWENEYLDEEVEAFLAFDRKADGTPLTGRGWAILSEAGLNGMFYIHDGDDSEFLAERPGAKSAGQ